MNSTNYSLIVSWRRRLEVPTILKIAYNEMELPLKEHDKVFCVHVKFLEKNYIYTVKSLKSMVKYPAGYGAAVAFTQAMLITLARMFPSPKLLSIGNCHHN